MYCGSCGALNDDTAWTCAQCGKPLHPVAASAPPAPPTVKSYLAPAIVVTVFCCWPLGIPAIVFAAQVNSKAAAGDLAGAQRASKLAKTWAWVAFGVGAGLMGLYALFMLFAAIMGATGAR